MLSQFSNGWCPNVYFCRFVLRRYYVPVCRNVFGTSCVLKNNNKKTFPKPNFGNVIKKTNKEKWLIIFEMLLALSVFVKGFNDIFYQSVTHHIFCRQMHHANAFNAI
jgi:hypothetical protein